ncbi:MAG: hypothetical protein UT75_C0008G0036 [Candidatus Yanofskybacteria bacterium GW2011_GWE2_40_11]|uniref:DUF5652 domain-containing protein n=1 Tax=Candidatus Yanofskybacteria bacterium GW2011_GWE2_40_11 TaxID=1619033 RepID=A0A0G0QJH1_9BACT|nr:MAG: hypothetical protein UT75_C0008G0036 [Candidatus Yanofskybacteria bacterium GW2011_GWE2_40_11]
MDLFANLMEAGKGVGWEKGVGVAFLPLIGVIFVIAVAWSLFWKGTALWKAAREQHKVWFVVLLLVNTLGILDILYIYVFSKMKKVA